MSVGLQIFTLFHVVLSLVGILAGLVVAYGFTVGRLFRGWNAWFLVTAIATCVTGFLFPFHKFLPSHEFGILSLILLSIAVFALHKRRQAGAWRRIYVISTMIALHLNVFILIVQLFEKVAALKALAPTQSDAPFKMTQLTVLVLFVLSIFASAIRFRELRPHVA